MTAVRENHGFRVVRRIETNQVPIGGDLVEAIFNQLHNPAGWREPIDICIPEAIFELADRVVQFYTATPLKVVYPPAADGMLCCHADGYRAGPAGP